MSWSRRFPVPIPLPDGGRIATLRDAGAYVAGLPKKTQQQDHWQTATAELLTSAERGGILMLAEIAMRQALARGRPATPAPARAKRTKVYRVIGADQKATSRHKKSPAPKRGAVTKIEE